MRMLWLCLAFGFSASLVSAQAITGYDVKFYNQGAQASFQTTSVAFTCNQTKPAAPSGTALNPSTIAFNDPANAGKACLYTDPGTGVLGSLPFGAQAYEATVVAKNTAGSSPESARSNLFTRPGAVPPAPQGLQIAKLLLFGKTVFGFRRGPVAVDRFYRLMPNAR
jgi:hypothetical protein